MQDGASDMDFQDKQTVCCADAIARGLREMKDGNYETALRMFTMALSVSPDNDFTQSGVLAQLSQPLTKTLFSCAVVQGLASE